MRIFHKECISLVTAGYDVCLIAPVDRPFEEKGVTVLPAGSWKNRYSRLLITVPRLLFLALKSRAEIFHFHDPELLLIAPILRLSGAQVIYDVHEDYITSIPQKSYIPKLLRRPLAGLAGFFETLASLSCHKVIAEKYYKDRFKDATAILNYPLSHQPDNSTKTVECSEFDPKFDWLLYTGNVTPDRGAMTHLRFLVSSEKTAVAYIGKCPSHFAAEIHKKAAEMGIDGDRIKIVVDMFIPPETIASYTHHCRWLAGIALFPETQHYEKKELTKFFEYMSAGLPVIASNFAAWMNVIEKNNCGLCISPDDPEGISKSIAMLQNDPESAQSMGRSGREAVANRYNWNNEAQKLVFLYQSLIRSDHDTS